MRSSGASPADAFASRRRAVRAQRWRRGLLAVVVVAVLAATGWLVVASPVLAVHDIEVSGAGSSAVARLTVDDVRAAVDVPTDTPLARVDLDSVAASVEQLAPVAAVSVERDWPNSLVIEVVERSPVATTQERGAWRAVDAEGVVFGAYQKVPPGLPAVSAEQTEPKDRDPALAEAAAVLTELDPAIAARLETVEVRSPEDVVLQLTSGEQVRWGSAEDSARKSEVLTVLLRVPAAGYDVSVPELPTTSQSALAE